MQYYFKMDLKKWNRKNSLNWDVSNVLSMKGMFKNASNFNSIYIKLETN